MSSILKQIKNNLIAIISLIVAVSSLGYATWRNELTETNRNVRVAGFEMLVNLGGLQQIVYLGHYDANEKEGSPRLGWVQVMVLRDLGSIMPAPIPQDSQQLVKLWQSHWQGIGNSDESVNAIEEQVEKVRASVITTLTKIE